MKKKNKVDEELKECKKRIEELEKKMAAAHTVLIQYADYRLALSGS